MLRLDASLYLIIHHFLSSFVLSLFIPPPPLKKLIVRGKMINIHTWRNVINLNIIFLLETAVKFLRNGGFKDRI